MYATNSSGKKASASKQTVTLSAHVEGGPEQLLEQVAATENGDELDFRMNKGSDSRGNYYARQEEAYDYDWTRSTKVGPNRYFGETLEQQEERHGREAEQARHSEVARAHVDGPDREASARQLTEAEAERADGFRSPADPRQWMDRDTLARVNQQAATLADKTSLSQAAASRRLAALVSGQMGNCDDLYEASFTVLAEARDELESPTPIADVSPYGYECTVEGEVTHIIEEPDARNQYQVLYLEDDEGTSAKVTVWGKSMHGGEMVRTLHEGDRVRISGGKPDEYNGMKTVAVTSDTLMCVIERGDGPAPTGHAGCAFGTSGESRTAASWEAESDTHQWANERDTDRAVAVTLGKARCPECSDLFDTEHGAATHRGIAHSAD
ncbi:hypothetical protein SG26_20175 (plasmid) [Haloarcula sp. CBA1115]|uniref:SOSS complex subunit B family protein n=1 Tax=unclassified Haloarcula TaxID=2624677 RepID=UPI0005955498|nr:MULTISPECIES: SOSS complex subunit B family protein [unclassified Haloarcula]AJF28063.1 hypothetical protein SG26_20175 [Haloarcula sp. CBA1115]